MDNGTQASSRNVTFAYLISVFIGVAASLTALFFIYDSFRGHLSEEGNVTMVNLAGKERLMAQKIGYYLLDLRSEAIKNDSPEEIADYKKALLFYSDLLEDSNVALSRGSLSRMKAVLAIDVENYRAYPYDKIVDNDEEISPIPEKASSIFFEWSTDLSTDIGEFIGHAREIANMSSEDIKKTDLEEILHEDMSGLISRFNSLALAYQEEEENSNIRAGHRSQDIFIFGSIIVILAALVEVIFIYRPLVSKIESDRQNLLNLNEKLKKTDKTKDELLRFNTHELRTPITVMRGYVSMILDGDLGPINKTVEKSLDKVFENLTRLLSIVNNILDHAKLQEGRMDFSPVRFCVVEFVKEFSQDMEQLAHERKQEFASVCHHGPVEVYLDRQKMKQILTNLAGNAVKFTPVSGKVRFESDVVGEEIRFSVIDTGPGIPNDQIGKIFEEFTQLENANGVVGTGLGLSIARKMAVAMGGRIEVESEVGKGSTFRLVLPLS